MNKARKELSFSEEFDVVLVNDNLDDAILEAEKMVRKFIAGK